MELNIHRWARPATGHNMEQLCVSLSGSLKWCTDPCFELLASRQRQRDFDGSYPKNCRRRCFAEATESCKRPWKLERWFGRLQTLRFCDVCPTFKFTLNRKTFGQALPIVECCWIGFQLRIEAENTSRWCSVGKLSLFLVKKVEGHFSRENVFFVSLMKVWRCTLPRIVFCEFSAEQERQYKGKGIFYTTSVTYEMGFPSNACIM